LSDYAFGGRVARGISWAGLDYVNKKRTKMSLNGALRLVAFADASKSFAMSAACLTHKQPECLQRCARGISLRFDATEIVDALVAGGYAREGVARVVTITAKGMQYLQPPGPFETNTTVARGTGG